MTTRRDLLKAIPTVGTAFAVSGTVLLDDAVAHAQEAAPLDGHFHPKGKAPSQFTLDKLDEARRTLPFSDTQDFDEQNAASSPKCLKKDYGRRRSCGMGHGTL